MLLLLNHNYFLTFPPFFLAHSTDSLVKVDCKTENHFQYGQNSILKCVIKPTKEATDAMITVVAWKKEGKQLVVFRDNLQTVKDPHFRFSVQNLNGRSRDVSLIVRNTQINDQGVYECMVMTDSGEPVTVKINLTVTGEESFTQWPFWCYKWGI